jgi:hypothetical protein
MPSKRDRKSSGSPRGGQSSGRSAASGPGPGQPGGRAGNTDLDAASMSTAPGFAAPRPAAATRGSARAGARPARRQLGIPDAVANRMARRIAIATGIPTLMGMGVFVASYLLVSRGILDIAPAATLTASGACFLLGLLGLSYGVLSSSWEEAPGTLLGGEQIGLNLGRVRASIRAMQQPGSGGGSAG